MPRYERARSGVRIPPGAPRINMIPHDDDSAESLAKRWHELAYIISIVATVSGIGIAVTAGIGAAWHKWAIAQHQDRIDTMEKESLDDQQH